MSKISVKLLLERKHKREKLIEEIEDRIEAAQIAKENTEKAKEQEFRRKNTQRQKSLKK